MKTRTHFFESAEIERNASAWIVRRDAGLSAGETEEFARWRAADPRHEEVVMRKEMAWATLGRPLESGQAEDLLERLAQRAAQRRRRVASAAAAAAVVILVLGVFSFQRFSSPAVAAHGTVLLPETRTLPDGSVVELRPGAELAVEFGDARRLVRLASGAAHFQVAEQKERPFVVQADGVEFRAVGTEFSVELGSQQVELLVTKGRVAVDKPADASITGSDATAPVSSTQTLAHVDAGNRMTVERSSAKTAPAALAATVTASEMTERLAWRVPRLEFSELPLAEAVQLMNRYNRVQFDVPNPDVARLRISGIFRADNTETFIRLLEGTCGIEAERTGDTILLKKARR